MKAQHKIWYWAIKKQFTLNPITKTYKMILNLGLLISLCIPNQLQAQNPPTDILDSLPTNFNYRVDTDSFAYFKLYLSNDISYFKESFTIGCNNQIDVKIAFTLTITHPFYFDYHHSYPKHKSGIRPVILYAVKKSSETPDSLIFKALDDYCFYGQVNFYWQSRDYILFHYGYGESLPSMVKTKPLWRLIENRLMRNLDSNRPIISRTQEIVSGTNPSHIKKIIKGKYIYCNLGLPPKPGISASQDECNLIIKLKWNNRATVRNKMDKLWRRKHWKWYMDAQYVYIDRKDGRGLYAYRMANDFRMSFLSNGREGGHYLRKLEDYNR